jgi:hypothetical protein
VASNPSIQTASNRFALAAMQAGMSGLQAEATANLFRRYPDDLPSNRAVILNGSAESWQRAKINGLIGGVGLAGVLGGWAVGLVCRGGEAAVAGGGLLATHAEEVEDELVALNEIGAGGGWATIGEEAGGAIGQTTQTSCGAACGEMLSGIAQAHLIDNAGAPTTPELLAQALGKGWRGGYVSPDKLDKLFALGRSFAAELYEGRERLGHFVVVDGFDAGHVLIRDAWAGGSTYRMLLSEFERFWTGRVVFR